MSIKGFHLIFITIAALFCAGFGVWALFLDERGTAPIFGVFTLITSVALVIYGVYFRRKSRDIIV